MQIEGRKYEVALRDGRVISRQRAHQMKKPKLIKASRRRYYEKHKEEIKARQKVWLDAFFEKHGMTYSKWYYEKKKADNAEKKTS